MKTVANVNGVKLEFVTRREGTEDCEVHFRLARKLYQAFLKFYEKKHNCFRAFELYAQGGGWYAAYSINFVKDGALRVRRLLHQALEHFLAGYSSIKEWIAYQSVTRAPSFMSQLSSIPHIVKKIVRGGKTTIKTISRRIQVMESRARSNQSLVDIGLREEAKWLLSTIPAPVNEDKLIQLKKKFSHQ